MSSLLCNLVYTGCTLNVVPGTLNKFVFSSRLSSCCSVSARRKEVHIDCSKAVCLENSTHKMIDGNHGISTKWAYITQFEWKGWIKRIHLLQHSNITYIATE